MNRSLWSLAASPILLACLLLALMGCTSPLPALLTGPTPFNIAGIGMFVFGVEGQPFPRADQSATVTVTAVTTEVITLPTANHTITPVMTTPVQSGEASAVEQAALIEAGYAIYLKQYCGICHRLDAAATAGTFGPPHNGVGRIAAERIQDAAYTGQATTAAEYLLESILQPEAYTVPDYTLTAHRMPAYTHLSAAELNALVAMLLAQQ